MMVYGDQVRRTTSADEVDRLGVALGRVAGAGRPIERHAALTSAFIVAGELLQGVADAEFEARGCDHPTPAQDAAMSMLMEVSKALARSWDSDFKLTTAPSLASLPGLGRNAPAQIACKTAEGHAYYAVYPEAFYEAGRTLRSLGPCGVVGVRSIGAGLSAMVAVAVGAERPITVRPVGDPFDRRLALSPAWLGQLIPGHRTLVVDEGPGLSGSSFAAVDEALEQAGAAGEVVFLPSHGGAPGHACTPERRARWSNRRRLSRDFDELSLRSARPAHRLQDWVGDLVGEVTAPLEDVSAGAWRRARGLVAPALPAFERRKFVVRGQASTWLLKFAGLGAAGETRLARAQALDAAGFAPPVAGLRHGFLVQSWVSGAEAPHKANMAREALIARLAAYITFRAQAFPATADEGATLSRLCGMAKTNLAEALPAFEAEAMLDRLSFSARRARPGQRIHVDGRMHAWEWLLRSDGALLKSDAVDHSAQHDLVGCQDAAWDVVGAAIEFDLSPAEAADLAERVGRGGGRPLDPHLLTAFGILYPAFQIGLWSLGGALDAEPARDRYRRALALTV